MTRESCSPGKSRGVSKFTAARRNAWECLTKALGAGSKQNLDVNIKEGSQVTINGPAVQLKDRVILLATEVSLNGVRPLAERLFFVLSEPVIHQRRLWLTKIRLQSDYLRCRLIQRRINCRTSFPDPFPCVY